MTSSMRKMGQVAACPTPTPQIQDSVLPSTSTMWNLPLLLLGPSLPSVQRKEYLPSQALVSLELRHQPGCSELSFTMSSAYLTLPQRVTFLLRARNTGRTDVRSLGLRNIFDETRVTWRRVAVMVMTAARGG